MGGGGGEGGGGEGGGDGGGAAGGYIMAQYWRRSPPAEVLGVFGPNMRHLFGCDVVDEWSKPTHPAWAKQCSPQEARSTTLVVLICTATPLSP
mgnify:CR=1 FL=1